MSTQDNGGSAFPESYVGADRPHEGIGDGMTLRDYMAAKAMPALIRAVSEGLHNIPPRADGEGAGEGIALEAYRMADFMLKARQS